METFRPQQLAPFVFAACALIAICSGNLSASANEATTSFDCVDATFSPTFRVDGTGFCLSFTANGPELYITKNKGHTWSRRAAKGVLASDHRDGHIIFSPTFAVDHAIYLHFDQSLYVSTDAGENFSLVDGNVPESNSEPSLSAFVAPPIVPMSALPQGNERVVFAYAEGGRTLKIDPPLHQPVPGSPDFNVRFLLPEAFPEQPGYVFGMREIPQGDGDSVGQLILYGCNAELTCADLLFEFPIGYQAVLGAWLSPTFDTDNTMYVAVGRMFGEDPDILFFRSTDGGDNFNPWSSVDELVEPIDAYARRAVPMVALASNAAFPKRLFLRVAIRGLVMWRDSLPLQDEPPTEQIFMSKDRGETWRSVGAAYWQEHPSYPGNLPWNLYSGALVFSLQADGRLFAIGSHFGPLASSTDTIFCSTRPARAIWSSGCP